MRGRCLLALTLACAACGVAEHTQESPPGPLADIPIEIRHGLPTVDVTVAGEPLKLFLDLGGYQPIALTSEEMARAKVPLLPQVTRFRNSAGEVFEARHFIARGVTVGGFEVGDLEGGEQIHGKSAPPDRNGYLGRPILGRYLLVLDYPQKRIRFYDSGDDRALSEECGPHRFRVDLVNGIAQTTGETEHGKLVFLWDTGATDNVVRPSSLPPSATMGRKVDDGPPIAELKYVSLGGHDVGPQRFRLVQFSAPAVDAYLGAGLLSSHKVCLDIPRNIGAVR